MMLSPSERLDLDTRIQERDRLILSLHLPKNAATLKKLAAFGLRTKAMNFFYGLINDRVLPRTPEQARLETQAWLKREGYLE